MSNMQKKRSQENSTNKKIDLKVATKEEAFWLQVKKETEDQIKLLEGRLKFEKAVLSMVELKLKEEKESS